MILHSTIPLGNASSPFIARTIWPSSRAVLQWSRASCRRRCHVTACLEARSTTAGASRRVPLNIPSKAAQTLLSLHFRTNSGIWMQKPRGLITARTSTGQVRGSRDATTRNAFLANVSSLSSLPNRCRTMSSSAVPLNGEAAPGPAPAMASTPPPTRHPSAATAAPAPSAPSGAKRRKQQKTNRVPQEQPIQVRKV